MVIAVPFAFGGKETSKDMELAELFVRFARKSHKTAGIVQLSDMETAQIPHMDSCFRTSSAPHGLWYFDMVLTFPEREFLRVDYDCMIRDDVSDIFGYDFDIAIAKEHKGVMNNGVVFVRDRGIYEYAKARYLQTDMDNWHDIQNSMSFAIDSGLFKVKKLPADIYNFIYKRVPFPDTAKIVHFKGDRKHLMMVDYGHVH